MQRTTALILFAMMSGNSALLPADEPTVATRPENVNPVSIGEQIGDAIVHTTAGKARSLPMLLKGHKTFVIFYRGSWCPYCRQHIDQIHEIEQAILDMGYQILALSPDKPELLSDVVAKKIPPYPLFSDHNMEAARAFGVAYKVGAGMLRALQSHGINLEEASGQTHHQLPVPSVFLLDEAGVVLFSYVNPDYTRRLSNRILMSVAEEFRPESLP